MLNVSADSSGHHGCSLWINLHHAYAEDSDGKHKVKKDHVVVTHYSSRHLQVHIEAPRLSLTVQVLHAPKIAAWGEDHVRAFWKERAAELNQRRAGAECVVLADANSHVGSVPTDHIGAAGAEEENAEGILLQQFLAATSCFVPSTFDEFHQGAHWTWKAPGQDGTFHRLDYVAVPITWRAFEQCTRVWYDLEALQTREDHMALRYQCLFCRAQPASSYTTPRCRAVRPPRDMSAEDRRLFAHDLLSAAPVPWHVDVDVHYAHEVDRLTTVGTTFCEALPVKPTQSYLTPHTLQLVQGRKAYRAYIRAEANERARRVKVAVFTAFRLCAQARVIVADAASCVNAWLADVDISIAAALERLYELTTAIRAAVKRGQGHIPQRVG